MERGDHVPIAKKTGQISKRNPCLKRLNKIGAAATWGNSMTTKGGRRTKTWDIKKELQGENKWKKRPRMEGI